MVRKDFKENDKPCLNIDPDDDTTKDTLSVDTVINAIGFGRFHFKLILLAGCFAFAKSNDGLLITILAPAIRCGWKLEKWQTGIVSSVVYASGIILGPLWGIMSDKYGRKPVLRFSSSLLLYFYILTIFSPTFLWMVILRFLTGGMMSGYVQSFALLSEFYPTKYRAKLMLLQQVFNGIGALYQCAAALLIIPRFGWRWHLAVSSIPPAFAAVGLMFVPESSRYYISKGDMKSAKEILQSIARQNKTVMPEGEFELGKKKDRGRIQDLFHRKMYKSSLMTFAISFLASFCMHGGQFVTAETFMVRSYSCGIEDKLETHQSCSCRELELDDYITMFIGSTGRLFVVFINLFLIDKIGRKKTLSIYHLFCGILILLLMICTPSSVTTLLIVIMRGLSEGSTAIIFIYTAEVFPTTLRSSGMGLSSSLSKLGGALTPFASSVLMYISVPASLSVYGVFFIVISIFAYLLPVETKGRDLQDRIELKVNDHPDKLVL